MKCIRFDVCKHEACGEARDLVHSSMKCIRFDVCKNVLRPMSDVWDSSSIKCIRFDVCKAVILRSYPRIWLLNEVHTF